MTAQRQNVMTVKTKQKPDHVANMPREAFDALALLNVYFFADLDFPGVRTPEARRKLLQTLHKHEILEDVEDVEEGAEEEDVEEGAEEVQARYNKAIEDHVEDMLPYDYKPTHDYWGAKCICLNPGWNAPKLDTYFAGDDCGYYMTFSTSTALEEYTDDVLEELDA